MYTQNDEEPWILKSLEGITGSFLDIGAYDGKTFSNTLRLAELGWSGICVEPAPSIFATLFNLHKDNANIQCVNAAIIDKGPTPLMKFSDANGDAVGSLNEQHVRKWAVAINFKTFWLKPLTLSELLANFTEDFAFVSIDVEGNSFDLFKEFMATYDRPGLKCISVEYDDKMVECEAIAKAHGFKRVHMTGENLIFSR
jgi:FkbM family methyltransferase